MDLDMHDSIEKNQTTSDKNNIWQRQCQVQELAVLMLLGQSSQTCLTGIYVSLRADQYIL